MCECVRDVCTCGYMYACRVHACAMPYFTFSGIHVYSCLLEALDNKICVGRLMYVCVCVHKYCMFACLNCDAFLRHSNIHLLTFKI